MSKDTMKLNNSPVTQHQYNDHLFLKRDDRNCSRSNAKIHKLLEDEQPEITTLINSYGSAQANSLFSLSPHPQIKAGRLSSTSATFLNISKNTLPVITVVRLTLGWVISTKRWALNFIHKSISNK
ncbi:hypothetical protein O9993_11100 [Vibrio lentus]|nr:hypothetical protein [Vibrio lentus]